MNKPSVRIVHIYNKQPDNKAKETTLCDLSLQNALPNCGIEEINTTLRHRADTTHLLRLGYDKTIYCPTCLDSLEQIADAL